MQLDIDSNCFFNFPTTAHPVNCGVLATTQASRRACSPVLLMRKQAQGRPCLSYIFAAMRSYIGEYLTHPPKHPSLPAPIFYHPI